MTARLLRWARMRVLRLRQVVAVAILHLLSGVSPRVAAAWLDAAFWDAPLQYPEPERETDWAAGARRVILRQRGTALAAYEWGSGPLVVLVHGWSGRGLQLGAFAPPLVARGFRVLSFDAPAHGRSPGWHTDFPEIARHIESIAAVYGPVYGLVAHSAGCAAALLAASHIGLQRLVCIGSFSDADKLLQRFHAQMRVTPRLAREHALRQDRRYGPDWRTSYSPMQLVRRLKIEGMVVHDLDDEETPHAEAGEIVRNWPRARLMTTQGLGHYRLLRDAQTVESIAEFLARP